jgi:hypothetical protein
MHKVAGEITLQQMLHEWAMHDLGHVRQIAELCAQALAGGGAIGGVLSAQTVKSTGPWRSRLSCGAPRSHLPGKPKRLTADGDSEDLGPAGSRTV